jgi:hypothetical protein
LVKLNEQQLNYFYSTADWKEFNKMMAYKTYFYGKLPSRNGLLSILLINANGSSATSLDCFLINKKGKIAGVFEPSHIDYDSESFGKGEFVNDSTYKLNEINYRPLGEGNNTSIKDSSSTLIRINHWGIIQKEIIISKKDTITEEEQ